MELHQVIHTLRNMKGLSQEEMAQLIPMSTSGYVKLEYGENNLVSDKLPRIAEILGVKLVDLMTMVDKNVVYLVNENSQFSANYYHSSDAVVLENEKLKLQVKYQQEIIQKLEREIEVLNTLVKYLEQKSS